MSPRTPRFMPRTTRPSTLPLLVALLLAAPLRAQAPADASHEGASPAGSPRTRWAIDDDWRYHAGGLNFAWSPSLSDAGWERVTIPHTWNAHDPFDDTPSYRRGTGWYRRVLRLDDALKGKRLFLYFEGANQVADVYVNGAFVGRHTGGYTAFAFDITRQARFDGKGNENLIAVRVDNGQDPYIPPLSVGYALYGGLYRDVWLVATDPVRIAVADHASSGVVVTTPTVSRDSAAVNVRGTIVNGAPEGKTLRVVSAILDRSGARVADASSTVSVGAGDSAAFAQRAPTIARPHLWSPDDPYLYTVRTEVYEGSTLRDRVENPLGFRWFHFDPARGFFLNGARLQLRGTTRHQDFEGLGSALSNARHVRDMELIKAMGANFVRLAHYPQDPAVLDAADRLGLLVWEEIPIVNYITPSPEFTHNARTMMRDMIRQHRNHPSVIAWGLMNEVFLWSPEGARIRVQSDTTYMREVRELAQGLDSLAHAEDPTRPTAMAIHGSGDYDRAGVAAIPDVLGVNVYDGWYSGTFDGFGKTLDRRHARAPEQPLFVSEYGAGVDTRVNSLHPERFDFSGEWQRMFHEAYLRQIAARPWLAGAAIWNEFDFSQPETGGSIPYVNQKGMLTWDRRPKDVYFLYKANWNPEPMVHIASHDWTRRAGTDSTAPWNAGARVVRQPVDVYSNLRRVELFLDGRSLGAKTPDDVRKATWEVPFHDGDNVVEARGERNGRRYDDRVVIHFAYHPPKLADPSVPFRELAVNVGSRAQFADDDGTVWVGDRPYAPGSYGYIGGDAKMLNKDLPITGTRQAPLYFTYREGIEGYRMDVPDGEYEVELLLAEPDAGVSAGARVFQVEIDGRVEGGRVDLAADGGAAHAAPVTYTVRAEGGHGIEVRFRAMAGKPVLEGIRVRRR
ncbi:MAG TPA: glycoside hydrolase family 2 TIM barrel-domain containing protein [Gemmatimonadaceae bacterium]|nr:glycoside hydrolase family 2 TIM barrel-domain containing protein [Gemmatimonadaceae bacterium]